jgi:ribose 5-phosphate isomerase B
MKVAIGSDHAGYKLKEDVKMILEKMDVEFDDLGTHSEDRVNYVPIGAEVAMAVAGGLYDRGILICGTGVGMCIVANKIGGIRAAHCAEPYTAVMSRRHNDANILVLGGWSLGKGLAGQIVAEWLTTDFEGGRHQERLELIKKVEEQERQSSS